MKKYTPLLWLVLLLVFPIVLWIMPAGFFDGEGFILCPSRRFFDFECLGCGMTRAIMHLHHFNFEEALFYNALSFLVYPALVILWFVWTRKAWEQIRTAPDKS